MQRRKFSREFKLEAVKLVRERGCRYRRRRDLDLHENVLRKWVREQTADPGSAFPGHGVLKPEQQEIERLFRCGSKWWFCERRNPRSTCCRGRHQAVVGAM